MNNPKDIQTFLSQWSEAEGKGDTAALAPMLTDDFLGVGPLGFVLPKQAWLERYASGGLKYDSFDLEEVQVREHEGAAVITTRINQPGTVQGNPIPAASRATLMVVDGAQGKQLAGIALAFIAGTPGSPPMPGQQPGQQR
jgi:hypothetical protein